MNSKEIVDTILNSMREDLRAFVEQESEIKSSVEYEDRVAELSRQFAKELILKSQGQMPKSRNSKKSFDEFWSS